MQKTTRRYATVNMAEKADTSAGASSAVPREEQLELLSVPVMVTPRIISLKAIQNRRGRFVKLIVGHKTITIHESGIPALRARIDSLIIVLGRLPRAWASSASESHRHGTQKNEAVHTEHFIWKGRKFYLDLCRNETGVSVRVSQVSMHRTAVFFPAQALVDIRIALSKVEEMKQKPLDLEETSALAISRVPNRQGQLPAMKAAEIHGFQRQPPLPGTFIVFEGTTNRHGRFLRISEKGRKKGMFVTLPYSSIPRVINILKEVREADGLTSQVMDAQNISKDQKATTKARTVL